MSHWHCDGRFDSNEPTGKPDMLELATRGDFEGAAALFVSGGGGVEASLLDKEAWDAIEAHLPTNLQLELEDGYYYPRREFPDQDSRPAERAVA